MTEDAEKTALRRKTRSARPPTGTLSGAFAAAIGKAVARAAEDMHQLAANLAGLTEIASSLADLAELPADDALILSLAAPDDRRALAIVDLQIVSGLVEHLTTGRIAAQPAAPRKPTRTDAVIVADFLDRVFAQSDGLLTAPGLASRTGYRFAGMLAEPRMIPMALLDVEYQLCRLRLDLARGVRSGQIVLAYPVISAAARNENGAASEWQDMLVTAVMASPAPLRAVLHRVRVPLAQIGEWTPGHMVELPRESLATVRLEGLDGRSVASAKLGQIGGMRAVRLLSEGRVDMPRSDRPDRIAVAPASD